MSAADTESALAEKLLRTLHLNVPERSSLTGGRVRFSTLAAAAERYLASRRCLPRAGRPTLSTTLIIVTFTLLGLFGCGCDKGTATQVRCLPSATTLPAPALVASEKPIILLYADRFGSMAGDSPVQPLEVAVWGDGRIVWRQNNALLDGRIDTKKIDELLQRLHREGVFGNGRVEYVNYGPDSGFDVIEARLPDRTLKLESWHDAFEQNPKLVATSHGITALEGRSRDAVLAAEPPEYLRFRRIWSDIRTTVKSWTPPDGQPFAGPDPLARGG